MVGGRRRVGARLQCAGGARRGALPQGARRRPPSCPPLPHRVHVAVKHDVPRLVALRQQRLVKLPAGGDGGWEGGIAGMGPCKARRRRPHRLGSAVALLVVRAARPSPPEHVGQQAVGPVARVLVQHTVELRHGDGLGVEHMQRGLAAHAPLYVEREGRDQGGECTPVQPALDGATAPQSARAAAPAAWPLPPAPSGPHLRARQCLQDDALAAAGLPHHHGGVPREHDLIQLHHLVHLVAGAGQNLGVGERQGRVGPRAGCRQGGAYWPATSRRCQPPAAMRRSAAHPGSPTW
jgi:hypothetical protein